VTLRRALIGALAALALGIPKPASAQDPSDIERAKASFKAGANAYAAGDYLAAIQALELAYELSPLPAIAFSLAQAERKQYAAKGGREHLERALELYQRYLRQEPNGARRNDASQAILELSAQRGDGAPKEAPTKQQLRPTRLMIASDTPGARISLDGSAAGTSPLIREVAPGKHRVRVQAPGYYDVERDVTAVSGELILNEVRLPERPTSLYVYAPDGSDIYVDGVYIAPGGPLVTIPLASGMHQLSVGKKGKRLVRRDIRLQRGQTQTEYVTLEATTQRMLSDVLLIAGGAALAGGIVLSGFAIRSEGKAETYMRHQRLQRSATPSELFSYNASLAERARFRTGAAIGIASSIGFFVTGVFLRELDQPRVPAAPLREAPEREAARPAPRVAFSPVTTSGDFGAALQLNF